MRYLMLSPALLGLLAAVPQSAVAQRTPEPKVPPRALLPFQIPDGVSVLRSPPDSLRRLLASRLSTRRNDLSCPMPVSRPDSLSTVPIPRARLTPNAAVPIPVDRTSCRNPLWHAQSERQDGYGRKPEREDE